MDNQGIGPPVDGASSAPPGWQLYRSGPWLVVHGCGTDSEDAAIQVREQCFARGVDIVLRPIDEVGQVRLDRFTGLVVVLPSAEAVRQAAADIAGAREEGSLLAGPPPTLRPFARLIVDYRARRPEGLESILNRSCGWFDAGVVQVVGSRAILQHPGLRTALDRVCARHYADDSSTPGVFQPYTTRNFVLVQELDEQPAADLRDESIERLWCDIQAWEVADMREVPKLRKCIDDFRDHYESKRFPQLYRPIHGLPRNRLDIILDGPHDVVIGDQKTWMENGARVWRDVEKELKKIVPDLNRPGGRDSTKDAQKQLRRLYRNLRIIENYMRGLDE